MTAQIERTASPTSRAMPPLALPARFYIDDKIYEKEKNVIFYDSWQMICHISDVKNVGDFCVGWVADQSVVVIRDKAGILQGFHNVCAHRAHQLLEGKGNTRKIVCPYHAWAYNLDGALSKARHSADVPCFEASGVRLKTVRIEVFCSLVFACINPNTASLSSQTFDMEENVRRFIPKIDSLRHVRQIIYDVRANWKAIVDNFLECYHCAVAHPHFDKTFDMSSWKHTNYDIHAIQGKVEKGREASGGRPKYTSESVWWLWPNLFIDRFPSDALAVCRNIPRSAEETTQVFDFYLDSDEPNAEQHEAIQLGDRVIGEDIRLVESVQRGLHSVGYQPGQLMIDPHHAAGWSEHGLWHFQQMVRQRLGVVGKG